MNTDLFKQEILDKHRNIINEAYRNKESRAAAGMLFRKYHKELRDMETYERAQWLRELGLNTSYTTEINKEIALQNYLKKHRIS